MKHQILIANNFIDTAFAKGDSKGESQLSDVATVVSNMAYYGYVPAMKVLQSLQQMSKEELSVWWQEMEVSFKSVTAADKNMEQFVVYKNFPKEVLEMSQSQYWIYQILMYWGVPAQQFQQPEQAREPLNELKKLKVLSLAHEGVFNEIFTNLTHSRSRWNDQQTQHMLYLVKLLAVQSVDIDSFGFKENGIVMAHEVMSHDGVVHVSTATDVLRLASVMSGGDAALRQQVKFKKFKRSERRKMLAMLDKCNNLQEDCTLRPEVWKKLLANLHPGDYSFVRVQQAYDMLYRNQYDTFNSKVVGKIEDKDSSVLHLLQTRPGEFVRRLHHLYEVFGSLACETFAKVVPALSTSQLLKVQKYVASVNGRTHLIYPPKGNWSKAQYVKNEKKPWEMQDMQTIEQAIGAELSLRLDKALAQGVDLDPAVADVKLQTNDQKLAAYGRGTVFSIPREVNFLRTASYWQHASGSAVWFDNGWNFFDEKWTSRDTCCWNSTDTNHIGAVFSGDPINSRELNGRACQMIDLYIDKLVASGIRYAVWNILSYNRIAFDDATELLATLQWGEEAQMGKLYEPGRAQMVFPVRGSNMTRYIAYVDLVERKLVYMDANLGANVSSADSNAQALSTRMPAFLEYLESLPSIHDLFKHAKPGSTPVWRTDEGKDIAPGSSAYVFEPRNPHNDFKPLNINSLLE